jgi:hypothetical protein
MQTETGKENGFLAFTICTTEKMPLPSISDKIQIPVLMRQ